MKTVNFKNHDESIAKSSYQITNEKELDQQLREQKKFSIGLKNKLKQSNFEVGSDPITDYRTMKKLMQDCGHENFIKTVSHFIEQRKNQTGLENRVFPIRNKKNSL